MLLAWRVEAGGEGDAYTLCCFCSSRRFSALTGGKESESENKSEGYYALNVGIVPLLALFLIAGLAVTEINKDNVDSFFVFKISNN